MINLADQECILPTSQLLRFNSRQRYLAGNGPDVQTLQGASGVEHSYVLTT